MDLAEKLAAIEEIKQLKARYWRLIDNKQFDQLGDIFAPDAVFDSKEALCDPVLGQMPGFGQSDPWEGRETILKGIPDAMPPSLQQCRKEHDYGDT